MNEDFENALREMFTAMESNKDWLGELTYEECRPVLEDALRCAISALEQVARELGRS